MCGAGICTSGPGFQVLNPPILAKGQDNIVKTLFVCILNHFHIFLLTGHHNPNFYPLMDVGEIREGQ